MLRFPNTRNLAGYDIVSVTNISFRGIDIWPMVNFIFGGEFWVSVYLTYMKNRRFPRTSARRLACEVQGHIDRLVGEAKAIEQGEAGAKIRRADAEEISSLLICIFLLVWPENMKGACGLLRYHRLQNFSRMVVDHLTSSEEDEEIVGSPISERTKELFRLHMVSILSLSRMDISFNSLEQYKFHVNKSSEIMGLDSFGIQGVHPSMHSIGRGSEVIWFRKLINDANRFADEVDKKRRSKCLQETRDIVVEFPSHFTEEKQNKILCELDEQLGLCDKRMMILLGEPKSTSGS